MLDRFQKRKIKGKNDKQSVKWGIEPTFVETFDLCVGL